MFGLFTYPKRLNGLYVDSLAVWLLHPQRVSLALEIAAGSYVTAAGKQRASMHDTFNGMSSQLTGTLSGDEQAELIERMQVLEIAFANASVAGLKWRNSMSKEAYRAVTKGDEQFFIMTVNIIIF